jgi:ABC-2 type transport system ATP-binding protein
MRAGEIVALGTPDELGGRVDGPSEIRFALPAGAGAADVPRAGDAVVRVLDGDRVLVTAGDGVAATHAITAWALAAGHDLRGFAVARPTLEDVYLELTTAPEETAR